MRLNVAITSYLLSVAVFVPVSGWAADRYGARRVFVAAIGLFTLSSVACALAQDLPQLVLARIVQGMAGAMMVPVGRIILLRTVPKQDLLKAMSFLSIPALLGPVIGPPLGGFMVTYMSWHWIFLINIPIGVLGIALVLRYVAEIREESAPGLDWLGFLLSAACLAMLVSGFEAIGRDIMPLPALLGLLAAGAASGLLYAWHARRVSIHHRPVADEDPHLRHLHAGRQPVPLHRGRHSLPAGHAAAGGFRPDAVLGRTDHLRQRRRRAADEVRGHAHRQALRLSPRADRQRGAGRRLRRRQRRLPTTPVWLMIAVLLVGGFFRSLQFTGVNTLTYADIPPAKMSRASSFAAMAQQLSISLGVGWPPSR